MRLRRLDLVRYGHFTDKSLELPAGEPDLHIVVGPNEAGKSTALSAVGDLLFGIPQRSPLNFRHENSTLLIGAALEADGESLEARRRKGSKNTLLHRDDTPLPAGERALRPYLGGADREFFERMFSLDHLRMREGGQELLGGSDDDAGRKLFAAGSGVRGLQGRLQDLDDEAYRLWAPRHSPKRTYYVAADKLKEADSRLREHTVSADGWRKLRRAYEDSKQRNDQLEGQIQEAERELSKIARIRRVARNAAAKARLDGEIEGLGKVAEITEDAGARLREAERGLNEAAPLLKATRAGLEKARAEREAMNWDEALLRREREIEALNETRAQVKKGSGDLPGLQRQLEQEQAALAKLAAICDWDSTSVDEIAAKIPQPSSVTAARELLGKWSAQRAQAEAARKAAVAVDARLEQVKGQLEAIGDTRDTNDLAALIAAARGDKGGTGSALVAAQTEAAERSAEVKRLHGKLKPRPDSVEATLSLVAPGESRVQEFHQRQRELNKELHSQREQRDAQHAQLARHEEYAKEIAPAGGLVTLEEMQEARLTRDSLWAALRSFLLGGDGRGGTAAARVEGDPARVAKQYEDAVKRADQLGDRRIETASSAAEADGARREIATCKAELAKIEKEITKLEDQAQLLDSEWRELWNADALPFELAGPDQMLGWLAARDKLAEAAARSAKSEERLAAAREQEAQAAATLCAEMERLGEDCTNLKDQRLAVVLERATDLSTQHKQREDGRKRLGDDLLGAEADAASKHSESEAEDARLAEIERRWKTLAGKLAVAESVSSPEAAGVLETLGEMREAASRIHALRSDRIGKIEHDMERFGADVKTLVSAIDPDLAKTDPSEAMIELEARLDAAKTEKDRAAGKEAEIRELEGKARELDAGQKAAELTIEDLQKQAGVSDIKALKKEIEKAEQRKAKLEEVAKLTGTILTDGDGLELEELVAECEGADLDELAGRERSLGSSTEQLRQEFLVARDEMHEAKRDFDRVGGSDAAAIAEGDRQSALAEIQDIAERYVQARAAFCLLRWAVERYQGERQGPMLQRAGELFAKLTLGSFERLALEFDDKDQAQIVAYRPNGERVPTGGMSDGSADQLYLALRVAALEDYLEHSHRLPFLADDLFINFDDERSAAGLEVLAELARQCQVVFFTHHDHLATLAEKTLDFPVRVLRV